MNDETTAQWPKVQDLVKGIEEPASEALATTAAAARDRVRAHPWRTVAIAALTGVVIGRLMSRRRED